MTFKYFGKHGDFVVVESLMLFVKNLSSNHLMQNNQSVLFVRTKKLTQWQWKSADE